MAELRANLARGLLLSFRCRPDAVASLLPTSLEPRLVGGDAVLGVHWYAWRRIRRRGLGWLPGTAAESVEHRVHVIDRGEPAALLLRFDCESDFPLSSGARLFPGIRALAKFQIEIDDGELHFDAASVDGDCTVGIRGRPDPESFPSDGRWRNPTAASRFHEEARTLIAPGDEPGTLDRFRIAIERWGTGPFRVDDYTCSWLTDPERFPDGPPFLDHGLELRGADLRLNAEC